MVGLREENDKLVEYVQQMQDRLDREKQSEEIKS